MSNFPIVNSANGNAQPANGVMALLGPVSKFADDFEDAFVFGKSGQLKVDQEHMDKMEAFVNNPAYRFFVTFGTHVVLPPLKFESQSFRGPLVVVMRNKMLATKYYGVCFTAYKSFCESVDRNMAADLLPPPPPPAAPAAFAMASPSFAAGTATPVLGF